MWVTKFFVSIWIYLIKSDSKDIYNVTKYLLLKIKAVFNSESSKKYKNIKQENNLHVS